MHTHVLRHVKWFRTCLDAGMQETQENTVRLPEDRPYAVSELIDWLYHGRFQTNLNDTLDRIDEIKETEPGRDEVKDDAAADALWYQYPACAQAITTLYFLAKKLRIYRAGTEFGRGQHSQNTLFTLSSCRCLHNGMHP